MLKVGHHGSESSTSYLWLREVMPQYAVISVGKDNSYGHPTEEVLSRLRDADVNPSPAKLTGEEIRESGAMPGIVKAMEHDMSDVSIDPVAAYKAIEEGVVGAYKAVEKGTVDAYRKVEDTMVDKLFRREGETVEEAKDRLSKK